MAFSCTNKNTKSILFVKNPFLLNETEKHFINSNYIDKIYLKFFKIDWNKKNELIITQKINYSEKPTRQYRIVPLIEISDNVSAYLQSEIEIEKLSDFICNNLLSISNQTNLNEIIEVALVFENLNIELQKNIYLLIKRLNKNEVFSDKIISLVIKLSQINIIDKNVVSAIDRLIVDFGNTGIMSDFNTINSLFDWNIVEPKLPYLIKLNKPISVMLNIQSRILVFRKNKILYSIENSNETLLNNNETFVKVQLSYYKVLRKTNLLGFKLEQGDILKIENINPEDYKKIARYLRKQNADVIIYPINDDVIKFLDENEIDLSSIFDYFY